MQCVYVHVSCVGVGVGVASCVTYHCTSTLPLFQCTHDSVWRYMYVSRRYPMEQPVWVFYLVLTSALLPCVAWPFSTGNSLAERQTDEHMNTAIADFMKVHPHIHVRTCTCTLYMYIQYTCMHVCMYCIMQVHVHVHVHCIVYCVLVNLFFKWVHVHVHVHVHCACTVTVLVLN